MTTRLMLALCIVLVAALPAPASQTIDHLRPLDEAAQDPSFMAFRKKLLSILQRKDVPGLKASLASNVLNNFGGGRGVTAFESAWKPHDPHSAVWAAMASALQLGGAFDSKTTFSAPYVFAAWPDTLGSFDNVAVVSADAVLRKAADPKAAIVRTLNYDILEVIESKSMPQHEAGADDWEEVKDRTGNHGFVLVRDVRSPLDLRATFERRNGKWVIASFVSGD